MKQLHAKKKRRRATAEGLPEKTGAIEQLTVGTMLKALQAFMEVGADEETPITFQETCLENQEITAKPRFDPKLGKTVIECIIIR